MKPPLKPRGAPVWGPPEIIEDFEQGSPEWIEVRLGIPTTSNFACLMRDGDALTRREYLYKLAGELLTGKPAEGKFKTAAMERGNLMEPLARKRYEQTTFADVKRVGFVRRKLPSGRYTGSSPDGLLPKRRGLEIKTMAPHIMIDRVERGAGFPKEHHYQVHGTMMVCDLDEVDVLLFYEGMPISPKFTMIRNEETAKEIMNAVEVFDHDLNKLVEKLKRMGEV